MKTLGIMWGALSIVIAGCGEPEMYKPSRTLYKYSFEETEFNPCTTGVKKFWNLEDYCDSLVDDLVNNSCAKSDRRVTYTNMCGDDWEEYYEYVNESGALATE